MQLAEMSVCVNVCFKVISEAFKKYGCLPFHSSFFNLLQIAKVMYGCTIFAALPSQTQAIKVDLH